MSSSDPPAYLLVETELEGGDAFGTSLSAIGGVAAESDFRNEFVRRPMRGIHIKRETFATLHVTGAGSSTKLANSSLNESWAGKANWTSNFILQSVQETRSEKFQPLMTFGPTYGFFFGEQPRMMQFTAILLNTADFQWEVEWWANYEAAIRGTRLADRGARAYMTFDDHVVEGYVTTATTSKAAGDPYRVQLAFGMWVTNVTYLISPGENKIAARHLGKGPLGMELDDGFTGLESRTEALSGASTTEAVRKENLEAVATAGGTGLLAKLSAGVAAVEGFIDSVANTLDAVKDWLYGRNMVIPAGFAGSEVTSGKAVFASGSGAEGIDPDALGLSGSSLTIRVPGPITGIPFIFGIFFENLDEYPARGLGAGIRYDPELSIDHLKDPWEEDNLLVNLAEATFAEFGYDITNEDGQAASDLERAAGVAAFAVLSYAAMATGASQAAASLTVGNVVGDATANEQQAAGEG